MRMIIEVDKYLLHLGKEYNWLKRSDIGNIDSHFLYQEHKVCERWYIFILFLVLDFIHKFKS